MGDRNRELVELGTINARYPELDTETMQKVRRLVEIRVSVRGATLNELFERSTDRDYIQAYQSMLTAAMEFYVSFNECLHGFADLVADISAGKAVRREHSDG